MAEKPAARARRTPSPRVAQARTVLAQLAARLMSEQGIDDPLAALRKAVARSGEHDRALWPDREDILDALRTHQRLFRAGSQTEELSRRREAAREAMRFLAPFSPCLTGAVLDGSADRHSAVELLLYAGDAEEAMGFLREHGVEFVLDNRRVRWDAQHELDAPLLKFQADGLPFALLVLPQAQRHAAPLRADGTRMERADAKQLEALIAAGG